jgi:UDP-glucose 4-epimerase
LSKILVTGASGFIGRHAVCALMAEGSVRTLHRGAALPNVADHYTVDVVRDPILPAMDDVTAVIHLAGLGDVAAAQHDPLGYNLVNAVGTLRVLEAARLRDATVLFASTQHVFRPSARRFTESSTPHPQNVYGASKLMAERWCEMYGEVYGLRVRVVRLFSVYGPGQAGQGNSGVVSIFFDRAARNEPLVVMSNQRRDFTHVADAVRGLLAALNYGPSGHARFNIGTGVGTSFGRLARMIRTLLRSESEIDDSRMERTSEHLIPSIAAARTLLGYQPRVSLGEGLQDYRDWTRQATLRSA